MSAFGGTLGRYFGMRFLGTVLLVFLGILVLVALLDYIEMMRRAGDIPGVSPSIVAKISFFRVPQILERIMPFCILIGAMSCYLNLSRRLELVVARAAGVSAWQFIAPALVVAFALGVLATTVYNPLSATLREISKRYEAQVFGQNPENMIGGGGRTFWLNQHTPEGDAIISARSSREQGVHLDGVSVFLFDLAGRFTSRVEARSGELKRGMWVLQDVRMLSMGAKPVDQPEYRLKTDLTPEQVRESFATPETVPFWELPAYITIAEHAGLVAAGYRLQFQSLIARPFLLAAMVFLAAAVSLRFFRFGGVQKMVLSGVAAGFLLYVLSKMTDDLAKAELMHPITAAWLPVLVGGLTGLVALLYQEDG
jgi:lipopolysaccharide export system permease protein